MTTTPLPKCPDLSTLTVGEVEKLNNDDLLWIFERSGYQITEIEYKERTTPEDWAFVRHLRDLKAEARRIAESRDLLSSGI